MIHCVLFHNFSLIEAEVQHHRNHQTERPYYLNVCSADSTHTVTECSRRDHVEKEGRGDQHSKFSPKKLQYGHCARLEHLDHKRIRSDILESGKQDREEQHCSRILLILL